MKKVVCVCLAMLFLLLAFPISSMAEPANMTEDEVLMDLMGMVIDGKVFNPDDYSFQLYSSEWHCLGAKEVGVRADGLLDDDYRFYLYFYQADGGCVALDETHTFFKGVKIWAGTTDDDRALDPTDYEYVPFIESETRISDNHLFVRFSVQAPIHVVRDATYVADDRTYSIAGLFYNDGVEAHWESFRQTFRFMFTDDGTLRCLTGGSSVLYLQLHPTVWRDENPTSESTPNTFNQISSVYFTIPKDYLEYFDRVDSIDADYKKYHSTPMIVTGSASLNSFEDIGLLRSGIRHNYVYGTYGLWDMFSHCEAYTFETLPMFVIRHGDYNTHYGGGFFSGGIPGSLPTGDQSDIGMFFSPSGLAAYNLSSKWGKEFWDYGYGDKVCWQVGWYFYNPNIEIDSNNNFYQAVSSAEMKAYMDAITAAYPGEFDASSGLASFLYDDFSANSGIHYTWNDEYVLNGYEFNQNYNWFLGLFHLDEPGWALPKQYVKAIEVIDNPSAVAAQYANNLSALSADYKIGKADVTEFWNYLQNNPDLQQGQEGVVVVLRFACDNYEMYPMYVVDRDFDFSGNFSWDTFNEYGEGKTWIVRQTFYRGVDVTRIRFSKDGHIYTYTVKSDPVDVVGGVDVKETPHTEYMSLGEMLHLPSISDAFAQMLKYLRIALLVLLGIVILVIVGKFAGLFRFLRLRRMMRKQRKKEKTKRKRD